MSYKGLIRCSSPVLSINSSKSTETARPPAHKPPHLMLVCRKGGGGVFVGFYGIVPEGWHGLHPLFNEVHAHFCINDAAGSSFYSIS